MASLLVAGLLGLTVTAPTILSASASAIGVSSSSLGAWGGACTQPAPPPPVVPAPYMIPCH